MLNKRTRQSLSFIKLPRLALDSPRSQRSEVRPIFELLNRIRCEKSLQFLLTGGWAF